MTFRSSLMILVATTLFALSPKFSLAQTNTFPSSGNVGVGTLSPQSSLDVAGSTGITLRTNGSSAGFSIFDRPTVPGDQLVFQGNAGNYSVFNVSTKNATVASPKLSAIALWTVDIANSANATQFQFQQSPTYGGVIFTQQFGTGAQGDKKISFQSVWNQTTKPAQLVLETNGNVGIGTSTPTNKLHVGGSITVDGNINAKYQDIAEWVESSQSLDAGTVVVLDATKSNQVIASAQAYDSRVAGVVSLQPGVVLGERGEGRVLVATTGRVKVRVDASNGPIQVGDLLVTNDKPGLAMKSVPVEISGVCIHRPGTLIGKALEPLATGKGEILVLLSLQ